MKTHHRCPKCAGKRIWVIEKYRVPGESAEGRELPVVPHQPEANESRLGFMRIKPKGHFDLFLCDGCGYSELWANGFQGLVESEERGVRLLDTTDPSGTPFR
jgi:predicted nucleic-acid-binding Zn-ribbon protein